MTIFVWIGLISALILYICISIILSNKENERFMLDVKSRYPNAFKSYKEGLEDKKKEIEEDIGRWHEKI